MEDSGDKDRWEARDHSGGGRGTARKNFVLAIAVACALALVILLAAFLVFQVITVGSKNETEGDFYMDLFFSGAGLLLAIFVTVVVVIALFESIRAVGKGQLDEPDNPDRPE
jgi:cation transporter-like permease